MINNKPKLMLFSHVSNTGSITGAEKLLLLFCRHISLYFHCVLVAPQEGKLTAIARKQGTLVQIQSFPLLYGMYTADYRLPLNADELRKHADYHSVVRLMVQTAPDLVLTNTVVNALPAIAAKSLGIPVIWKITEVINENEFTPAALKIVEQYSDWLIAISGAAARVFQGTITKPTSLLPPSSDNERLHPFEHMVRQSERKRLKLKADHKCIGYISSFIHQEKGLKEFVRMALSLCGIHPECRFVVIGKVADQVYFDSCVTDVRFSGYKSRFQFITFVESVQSVYSAMDILVIPSMVPEGFGMTAMEGMLCGKPVVAFASGGLGELMESTGNGHLAVTTGDYEGLAAKVSGLINNPDMLQSTGTHNAQIARALYGIEAYQLKLQGIIGEWQLHRPQWLVASNETPPQEQRPVERGSGRRRRRRPTGRSSASKRVRSKRSTIPVSRLHTTATHKHSYGKGKIRKGKSASKHRKSLKKGRRRKI